MTTDVDVEHAKISIKTIEIFIYWNMYYRYITNAAKMKMILILISWQISQPVINLSKLATA